MKRAFVFPGQGAQFVGMGKELAKTWTESRRVFEEVDEALGEYLSKLAWSGPAETLTLTENAQPALMATSIAAVKALEAEGVQIDLAQFFAGHSLGEYSALCAAGSVSISDTARLLRTRGRAMQAAVPIGTGAMAVLLGADFEKAQAIAEESREDQVCDAANDNDPKQVVVSGHREAVERAVAIARSRGVRRAVMLQVSAPFHCSLMEPAAAAMEEALELVEFAEPSVPVVSNVSASPETSPARIKELLVRQVTGTVRWRESIQFLAGEGIEEAWELGAGNALTGMIKRTARSIACAPVGEPRQAIEAAAKIGSG